MLESECIAAHLDPCPCTQAALHMALLSRTAVVLSFGALYWHEGCRLTALHVLVMLSGSWAVTASVDWRRRRSFLALLSDARACSKKDN